MRIKGNPVDWQTRLRLWAGLTLAAYAIGYNIYYCLGIVSLDAMEVYHEGIVHLWPVFWLVPFAVVTHASLGLWKLFKRNTLKLPLWEATQIVMGITIPFFLLPHLIATHGMFLFFGVREIFLYDLLATYPSRAWQFTGMALAVWIHAQIGVHAVLRMRSWYPEVRLVIAIVFSLMPVLGIAGYMKAGNDAVSILSGRAGTIESSITLPTAEQQDILSQAGKAVYATFPAVYMFTLVARGIRLRLKNKHRRIEIRYGGGIRVSVFEGTSLLEASRIGNIPHASICGGRGRCTTCRVKVEAGMENLSPIGEREKKALSRIGAAADVRLACQAECQQTPVTITLLLPPDIQSIRARQETRLSIGAEMELIVMFADLRGFTRLAEDKFPYDVVFILNKYFQYMGEVVEKNQGKIDKFMGDGFLSYFGLNSDLKKASTDALRSARQMSLQMQNINRQLQNDLKEPLQLGVSIHCGEVILGEVGYKDKASMTIIGDAVNTASRMEHLNKALHSQLIISSRVAELSGMNFDHVQKRKVEIRGKAEPLQVFIFTDIIQELMPEAPVILQPPG